ncbi:MAG TPA: hypothetical protein VGL56_10890 [Fimbriimonadaceae bacterium]|jgi:hypothetical protein
MKRFIGCLAAMATVACALAQAPFTIVRPADGAKVRETVHVLFPKNSVPTGGYVGIFVNSKFIEAVVPSAGAKFLDYSLNTKSMDLPDGPTTIEAVLYMDFAEKPRIVDKSSVQVTIANKANINVPANGFLLRYAYQDGHQWLYHWDVSQTVSTISESEAKMGGHASEVPVDNFYGRLLYSVDNTYGGGDALLRLEIEPPTGKKSIVLPLQNNPVPRRVLEQELYPVYMKVSGTGSELYGLIPYYFGFNGVEQGASTLNVMAIEPLPMLPTKAVKPGASWITRFQLPSSDDQNFALVAEKNTLVDKIPARGEFEGVEWEMGYPCAKIHNTFTLGSGGAGEGVNDIKSNARSVDETYWFALDRGVVVKLIRSVIIDKKMDAAPVPNPNEGGGPGMGGPGGFRGNGGPRLPGLGAPGNGGERGDQSDSFKQQLGGKGRFGQGGPGRGPGMGGPGMGGPRFGASGPGGPGGQQGSNTGQYSQLNNNTPTSSQLYRVEQTEVLTLEH